AVAPAGHVRTFPFQPAKKRPIPNGSAWRLHESRSGGAWHLPVGARARPKEGAIMTNELVYVLVAYGSVAGVGVTQDRGLDDRDTGTKNEYIGTLIERDVKPGVEKV